MKKILLTALALTRIGTALAAQDLTVDIAVIGAGGAGLSAAVEAAQLGASVVVVEKMPAVGGNTLRASGGFNAAGTALQRIRGIEDSEEIAYYDTMKGGHWTNNPELVRTLVREAPESLEWLLALGADLRDIGLLSGASLARAHRPTGGTPVGPVVIDTLYNSAKDRQVDIRTNTTALKLLTNSRGEVTGLTVRDETGTYRITAHAVINAAGGFAANHHRIADLAPTLRGFATTNSPGTTGDGIAMAEKIGARTVQMDKIQTHPTVVPGTGVMITEAVRGHGGLLINRSGHRFVNELAERDTVSAAILSQPDAVAYLFFDTELQNSLKATDTLITKPFCLRGDTTADLAAAMSIDPAVLDATLAAYRDGRDAGTDVFGRSDMPLALSKGPFYAVAVSPAVHHTMGGLAIDAKTRVINRNGEVIPGLYAAGEVTGGIHGDDRLSGNALSEAITFGRLAGREAFIRAKRAS